MVMKILIGALLLITALQDVRNKKINTSVVIFSLIIVLALVPFSEAISLLDRALGLLTGGLVIGISKGTGGKIGMGDGMILSVTGIALGFWTNIELFAIALLLAAVVSILLLITKRVNRKQSIPFVPFLLLGYLFLVFTAYPISIF